MQVVVYLGNAMTTATPAALTQVAFGSRSAPFRATRTGTLYLITISMNHGPWVNTAY